MGGWSQWIFLAAKVLEITGFLAVILIYWQNFISDFWIGLLLQLATYERLALLGVHMRQKQGSSGEGGVWGCGP